MAEGLLIAALLNVLVAAVYAAVGGVVSKRQVSDQARLAKRAFSAWWWVLAAVSVGGALANIASVYGVWTLASLVVYTQVLLALILGALAALLYYFVFLRTGWRGVWKPIAAFYALYYIAILYYLAVADPVGITRNPAGDTLEFGNDLTEHPVTTLLGLLLLMPSLIGAIGYFSLFGRIPDRSGRFRVAVIAGAFIFWFGTSIMAGFVFDVTEHPWWRHASTGVAVVASYAVYLGFRPTRWMRRRFGLTGYDERPA